MKENKIVKQAIIFILLIIATFYVIFKNDNPETIINDLKNMNSIYIYIGLLGIPIFVICEGVNIGYGLKLLGYKPTFWQQTKYALAGFFFSSISPASTAGQPMQAYYMYKDKINVSHSSLALLLELTGYIFCEDLLAIIGYIFDRNLIIASVGQFKYLITAGILFNILYFIFLLSMLFWNKISNGIIKIILNILKFFHYRKIAALKNKLDNYLQEFQKCSVIVKNNPNAIIKMTLITLFKLIATDSITYFVYRGFGLNTYNYFTLLFMQAVLNIMMTLLPLPGSVGVDESGFMILFRVLFPIELLSSAMLASRILSFYFYFIVIGIILGLDYIIGKRKNKTIDNT